MTFLCPSTVYLSHASHSSNPRSHRTCNRPLGFPWHPGVMTSFCSESSIPFCRANSWSSFLVYPHCCWSVIPLLLRQQSSTFFDLSTNLLLPVGWSYCWSSLCSGARYHGPESVSLNTKLCTLPTFNTGECEPRYPSSWRIIVSLIIPCATPYPLDMFRALRAPLPLQAWPWLWSNKKTNSKSGYRTC